MNNYLNKFWTKMFNFDWKFGTFLIILFCIPRFLVVLNANENSSYQLVGIVMLVYILTPFLFLTKKGRKKIGLVKSKNIKWMLLALIIGVFLSISFHYLGKFLYHNTTNNWYQYIAKSYNIPVKIDVNTKLTLFYITAITGMLFSPIGEEVLFRGIIHSSFAESIGDNKASIVDSLAFALVHISHFGLIYNLGEWKILPLPTLIWVSCMYIASRVFYILRKKTNSIIGSIICHAGFNLGMTYSIFYLLN